MEPKVIELGIRYFTSIVSFKVDFGGFNIEVIDYDMFDMPIKDENLIQIALDKIKQITP